MPQSPGPLESQKAGPFPLTGIHPAPIDDNQGEDEGEDIVQFRGFGVDRPGEEL